MQVRVLSRLSVAALAALLVTSLLIVAAVQRTAPRTNLDGPGLNPLTAPAPATGDGAVTPATGPGDAVRMAPRPAADAAYEASTVPAPAAPEAAATHESPGTELKTGTQAPETSTQPLMRGSRFADIDPDSPYAGRAELPSTARWKFKPAAGR
jgi:hypothetical protein